MRVGSRADGAQDAIDDRIEQPGVGHDAEVEDGEHEHRRDRRRLLQAADDELRGLEAEPADERRRRRHDDQRHERRHPPAHDDRQQNEDRRETEERQHQPSAPLRR